jgi:hypothetical protein
MDPKLSATKLRLHSLENFPTKTIDLSKGLYAIATIQKDVSSSVPGCIPEPGKFPDKQSVAAYTLAMIVETTEFLQTLPWKPWKTTTAIDRERVIDEFADILAFQGILVHYLNCYGITCDDLAEGYRKKSIVNIQRFMGQHSKEYQMPLFKETEEK